MSPELAGRTAIVCTLVLGVAIAHAERRRVAVIDLSSGANEDLAKKVGDELVNHAELQVIYDQSLIGVLIGKDADEDARDIALAQQKKQQIDDQLAQFDRTNVVTWAADGQAALHRVVPTPRVLALYADLAFATGWAKLGDKKPDEAAVAFELCYRLAPERVPDPNSTPPDVAAAFEAAVKVAKGRAMGELFVVGSGIAWIDGKEMGKPGGYQVPAGPHVVWITGPERETRGTQAIVSVGRTQTASVEEAPAQMRVKVLRARATLRDAPDSIARASAMKNIAKLLDVHDVVMLRTTNGKVIAQTWRDEPPGFSALREYKGEKPEELLWPLAPPPQKIAKEPPHVLPVIPETPWYRQRKYQIPIGGVLAVVATFFIINQFNPVTHINPDPTAR